MPYVTACEDVRYWQKWEYDKSMLALKNVYTRQCLTITDSNTLEMRDCVAYECREQADQKWKLSDTTS